MKRMIFLVLIFMIGGYAYSWSRLGEYVRVCLPMSTLQCEPIQSFIETYLIPMYREKKGTEYVDRIYVEFYDFKKDGIGVCVSLFLQHRGKFNFYIDRGLICSVTKICDVPVFLIGYESCPYIELDKSKKVCFDCYNGIIIDDGSVDWGFIIKDNDCKYIGIHTSGARWLRNMPMEKYIPGFRPIKRITPLHEARIMKDCKVSPPEHIYNHES